MIVCLGWESLILRKDAKFPVVESWYDDWPDLSIEFARQSQDGQITLVIRDRLPGWA